MNTRQDRSRYHAFLLRCWAEGGEPGEKTTWRFSLERVGSSKRVGFNDLEAVMDFLFGEISPQEGEAWCE